MDPERVAAFSKGIGDYMTLGGYMTAPRGMGGYMTAPRDSSLGHDVADIVYTEPPVYWGLRVVSALAAYFLARKFGKKGAKGHTNALVWGAVGGILNPLSLAGNLVT